VCCSVLQCVAGCCSVKQYVAVCCSVLQCVAVSCSVLQGDAVCCSVLWCDAVCCSVMQCDAVCCSASRGRHALDFTMFSFGACETHTTHPHTINSLSTFVIIAPIFSRCTRVCERE